MITIYGKSGCGKCKAAAGKLALLGHKYNHVFLDAEGVHRHHPSAVDAMVEETMKHGPETWPMILVDDRWMDYPEAMAYLRAH